MAAGLFAVLAFGCGSASREGAPSSAASSKPPEHTFVHDYPYELNAMIDRIRAKDYAGAEAFLKEHLDACKASQDCAYDAQVLYINWEISYENVGDWQGARATLQTCVAVLNDPECTARLADVESRHRF